MKRAHLRFGKGFAVSIGQPAVAGSADGDCRGESEGGADNRHGGADQWLFVVSGSGVATVGGRRYPLRAGSLILIERGEIHEIRATGRTPLKTLNIYVPPPTARAATSWTPVNPRARSSLPPTCSTAAYFASPATNSSQDVAIARKRGENGPTLTRQSMSGPGVRWGQYGDIPGESEFWWRDLNRGAARGNLYHRRCRPDHLLQRSCCCSVGMQSGDWQERMVRLLEAVLARRHTVAARRMPHGGRPEDRAAGQRHRGCGRAARRHACRSCPIRRRCAMPPARLSAL
jgi:mannose-6-phosphate isomerase-like protein (cupin superfamily)